MSRPLRYAVAVVAAAALFSLLLLAFLDMPSFGGSFHPYRTHSVPAAVQHATSNVVSSVNFDQRGLDTLIEESILLASVLAVSTLLRPRHDETERHPMGPGRVLDSTALAGWVLLPVSLIIGLDVVAHGHVTPGGGFQGGVILGTALHLLYLAGTYRMLERVRPVEPFEWGEAVGAGAFACLGVAGAVVGLAFLENIIAQGDFGTLFSGGTVPILNGAVGIEVASGVIVLLARFFQQAVMFRRQDEDEERTPAAGAAR